MIDVLTRSIHLPRVAMPLKHDAAELDLREHLEPSEKRGLARRIITSISGAFDAIEGINARSLVRDLNEQYNDLKFNPETLISEDAENITNDIRNYYRSHHQALMQKLEPGQSLDIDTAKVYVNLFVQKSNAFLRAVDQMHFNPKRNQRPISSDLRRVLIYAENLAKLEVIRETGFLNASSGHHALSNFELLTDLTPHYGLSRTSPHPGPVKSFMPIYTDEIDWQDESLKFLGELFELNAEQLEEKIKYLGLFSAPELQLEGFANTKSRKPYVNFSGKLLDQLIMPGAKDPEIESIPFSTAVHEMVHALMQERYPKFFSEEKYQFKNADLLEKHFNFSIDNNSLIFKLADLEELLCFTTTIYANPITTLTRMNYADLDDEMVKGKYGPAVTLSKYLYDYHGLRQISFERNRDEIPAIQEHSFNIAKDLLNQLDDIYQNSV